MNTINKSRMFRDTDDFQFSLTDRQLVEHANSFVIDTPDLLIKMMQFVQNRVQDNFLTIRPLRTPGDNYRIIGLLKEDHSPTGNPGKFWTLNFIIMDTAEDKK